jgi:serine/threonine protein kinase
VPVRHHLERVMPPEKYQYERRLGGGGMAEVFLAHTVGAEGFQRPVAIKRVLPSFSQDAQFATMFVNEARISAMLRHPNIVQVLDFDRDAEGRLFLVMELVEGKDLDALARSGLLPLPVAIHVIAEVLEGLAHAHEMTTPDGRPLGLVHRDISPHNVLVSWDGAVKVSDFGIAKAMLASGAGQSGMIKGKPLYMAPEQVTSPGEIDHRADLFAVGVMFYELLTGRRVYQGTTNEEILTDVIQVARGWRQLVAPNAARPDLPWDVSQAAAMLLAPDRRQRFASARDALDAVLRCAATPTRGTLMLSELMTARFPNDVPRRRMSPQQRAAAPTVVPEELRPGGSGSAVVKQRMSAETRTIEPVPASGPVSAPVPAVATVPGKRAARSGSRVPVIVGLAIAAAVIAAAVTLIVMKSSGGGGTPAVVPDAGAAAVIGVPDAAMAGRPPVDAAVAPVVTDAAPVAKAIDAGVVAPDAGHKHEHGHHAGSGTGTGTGTGSAECPLDADGIPRCR